MDLEDGAAIFLSTITSYSPQVAMTIASQSIRGAEGNKPKGSGGSYICNGGEHARREAILENGSTVIRSPAPRAAPEGAHAIVDERGTRSTAFFRAALALELHQGRQHPRCGVNLVEGAEPRTVHTMYGCPQE